MSIIIIQGSARSKGNTYQITQAVQTHLSTEVIDLNLKNIHAYSYEHEHLDDDFLGVMKLINQYDTIIFITPVYWYSMSGIMKNFFDRITDCLIIEKALGRSLKGKKMAAIACGSDNNPVSGFFVPFRNTAEYLDMHYLGDLHTWIEQDFPNHIVLANIEHFTKKIKNLLTAI